jgi:hypothetical protein
MDFEERYRLTKYWLFILVLAVVLLAFRAYVLSSGVTPIQQIAEQR